MWMAMNTIHVQSLQLMYVKQYLNTKCRRPRVPYGNGDAPRKRLQPCTAVTSSSSASCAVLPLLQVPSLPTHSVPRHDRYHVSPERLQLTATTLFDWLNVIVASRMRGGCPQPMPAKMTIAAQYMASVRGSTAIERVHALRKLKNRRIEASRADLSILVRRRGLSAR